MQNLGLCPMQPAIVTIEIIVKEVAEASHVLLQFAGKNGQGRRAWREVGNERFRKVKSVVCCRFGRISSA